MTAKKTAQKTARNSKPKQTPVQKENIEKTAVSERDATVVSERDAKVDGIICADGNGAYPHALATDALYIVESEDNSLAYPVAVVDIFGKRWYAKAEQVCRKSL